MISRLYLLEISSPIRQILLSILTTLLCNLRSTHRRAKLASRDDFRGFPKGFALSAHRVAVNKRG